MTMNEDSRLDIGGNNPPSDANPLRDRLTEAHQALVPARRHGPTAIARRCCLKQAQLQAIKQMPEEEAR